MGEKRVDRRVRRTKRRLKEALLELIDERGYDGLTIRDLTERADVGRSTFYSHYRSKEDLLFHGFDTWLLSLVEGGTAGGRDPDEEGEETDRLRFARPLLEHMHSQAGFFRATIVEASDPWVRRRVIDLLVEVVRREPGPRPDAAAADAPTSASDALDPDLAAEARAHAIVGALLGLVAWWLDGREDLDVGAIDGVFQRIAGSTRAPLTPERTDPRR